MVYLTKLRVRVLMEEKHCELLTVTALQHILQGTRKLGGIEQK